METHHDVDSLRQRVDAAIQELGVIIGEIEAVVASLDMTDTTAQLTEIAKTISRLEKAGASVPEELRNLRIDLAAQVSDMDALAALQNGLSSALAAAAGRLCTTSTRKRRRARETTARRDAPRLDASRLPPLGSTLVKAELDGATIVASTWADLLYETAQWILGHGGSLPADGVVGQSRKLLYDYAATLEQGHGQFRELSDGRYISTKYSSSACVRGAYQLLECAGLDPAMLHIEYE